jgi:bacillithiol synthase
MWRNFFWEMTQRKDLTETSCRKLQTILHVFLKFYRLLRQQQFLMQKTTVPFQKVPQLAPTDVAYAIGDERLQPFYLWQPQLESIPKIVEEQTKRSFPREDLLTVLKKQYRTLPEVSAVSQNIAALGMENGFTVATAHQPSLFLGPLYFIYKALTVINLAEESTRAAEGKYRVVPVFILGSEDHDLEELNKVNLFGKKIIWSPEQGGAVGNIPTETLKAALAELADVLGSSEAAVQLHAAVTGAYSNKKDFAAATQALLHHFLGSQGLIVLDMNDPLLKRHFVPIMRAELLEQPAQRLVKASIGQLQAQGFKAQATPRDINLFYLRPGSRERIILEDGHYQVLNSPIRFKTEEILAALEANPEHFSPNVVLRPLYQECILPNLAYVGGGGELAYWLERRSLFEYFGLSFPMLVRRNSVLWLDKEAEKKRSKLGFSVEDFFGDVDGLIRQFLSKNATGEISLDAEIRDIEAIFDKIAEKSQQIDATLEKSVRADQSKALAVLEQWQSRLVRAEKQKHEVSVNQIRALKEKLFPGNGLQERYDNFLPYVLRYGLGFLDQLRAELDLFDPTFTVFSEA